MLCVKAYEESGSTLNWVETKKADRSRKNRWNDSKRVYAFYILSIKIISDCFSFLRHPLFLRIVIKTKSFLVSMLKSSILMPDSNPAWKFIPKNLLREPFQLCFSPIWCLFWHNRSKMSEKIAKSSASLYFIYVLNFSLKKYFSVTNREAKN